MESSTGPMTFYDLGNRLSYRIIEAAREVHQLLGPTYAEEYYRKAVINSLQRLHIDVQRLFPVDAWQGAELANLFFLDLYVEMQVVVQVKACRGPFAEEERAQMAESLRASGATIGVLLNFGKQRLEYERVLPNCTVE